MKEFLKDPIKFVIAATLVIDAISMTPAITAKENDKKEEPVEESDNDMGFSLFDKFYIC